MTPGENQWRAALNAVDDVVVLTDARGEIVWINAAGARMFGYDGDDLVGRGLGILLPGVRAGEDVSNASVELLETRGRSSSGVEFAIRVSASREGDGDRALRIFVVRDATAEHGARAAEFRARTTRFAHELNQPLAAAGAFIASAQRLLRAPPSDRVDDPEEALRRAAAQIDRMSDVISRLRAFVAESSGE